MRVLVDGKFWNHPKLKRLARSLSIPIEQAGGHLIRLWNWCADYHEDGSLVGLSALEIAEASGWNGDPESWLQASADAGWIDRGASVSASADAVHDWFEHQGRFMQKMYRERERKRIARENKRSVRGKGAEVPRNVLTSGSGSGSGSGKEQEQKEEDPPTPPKTAKPPRTNEKPTSHRGGGQVEAVVTYLCLERCVTGKSWAHERVEAALARSQLQPSDFLAWARGRPSPDPGIDGQTIDSVCSVFAPINGVVQKQNFKRKGDEDLEFLERMKNGGIGEPI